MDVGRVCVLSGSALCLHAAWSHCSHRISMLQLAARVELVGVLGARGCMTSVRSYSDPPIQLGKGQ